MVILGRNPAHKSREPLSVFQGPAEAALPLWSLDGPLQPLKLTLSSAPWQHKDLPTYQCLLICHLVLSGLLECLPHFLTKLEIPFAQNPCLLLLSLISSSHPIQLIGEPSKRRSDWHMFILSPEPLSWQLNPINLSKVYSVFHSAVDFAKSRAESQALHSRNTGQKL